nr:hypothetical protein [Pulveribacter sp.]
MSTELVASQRAQAIKRRKAIWEALHPGETGGKNLPTCLSDGRAAGPQHEQGFAASTAAAAGMTKQAINQHLSRAEALGDDLPSVAGASLDKGDPGNAGKIPGISVWSGLGVDLSHIRLSTRLLKVPRVFEKRRFDGHFNCQAHLVSQALHRFSKLGVVLQVERVQKLLRGRVLRHLRSVFNISLSVGEPLKSHCKRFRELGSYLRTRLAAPRFIAGNLRRSHATDLSQLRLAPAMPGPRLDEAVRQVVFHTAPISQK